MMQYRIVREPMAMLEVALEKGEKLTAEAGAMVYTKGDVEIRTRMREGGLLKKIKVSALGGESFFVNDFIANGNCMIGLSGAPIGDLVRLDVQPGSGYILQSGSYVASTEGVTLDTKWQGFKKGIFGSEFFMLKATGQGGLFLNAYGGIIKKDLQAGEKMLIDNYHLVALGEQASYDVVKVGGLKTTILGGEGFATEVKGPGTVYFQTKNLHELHDILRFDHRAETNPTSLGTSVARGLLKLATS